MKKTILFIMTVVLVSFTNCTNINKSMREPNTRVNLEKKDFTLSDQVSGEATTTQILGIDFARLFLKKSGTVNKDGVLNGPMGINLASIPVIGGYIINPTASYALYNIMENNKGYDVVFYPQYEVTVRRPIGLGFIYKVTTVKATTRLGKLNK
jgi:hypothetical protein